MYLMAGNKEFSFSGYTHFIYRRFLRIAPAFYVSVLVYALIIKEGNTDFSFIYNVLFHFLFLNNIVTGNTISAPLWSIGTEWHFYLFLPLFIIGSKKSRFVKTVILFSMLSILLFCFVNLGYLSFTWWEKQIWIRFPEFGVGIIAAHFFKRGSILPGALRKGKGLLIALVIIYIGRSMKFTAITEYLHGASFVLKSIALPVMTSGFGLVLYHVITESSRLSGLLSRKWITYLGRISYSIYLWHSLVIFLLSGILLKIE